jgi:hypothetical protein
MGPWPACKGVDLTDCPMGSSFRGWATTRERASWSRHCLKPYRSWLPLLASGAFPSLCNLALPCSTLSSRFRQRSPVTWLPQLHQKPSLPMQQHHATPMPQVPSDLNPGPCPSYRHIPPLAPLGRRAGRSTWPWAFPNHEIERQHSTFTLSAGWETTTGRPPTWALLLFPVAAASLHDRPARRGLPIRQPRRRRRLSPPAHERAVSQNQSQTELEPLADSSRIRMRRQHPQTAATIQPASRESAQRVGVRRFITAEDTTGGDHPAGNSP